MRLLHTIIAAAAAACLLTGAAAAKDITVRIANVAPDTHPSSVVLREMADALNKRDDVQLSVELFTGGVLGGELETLDQLSRGAIEGVLVQGISLFQGELPEMGVEELPFLFPSREAAYKAVDGDFGKLVADRLAKQGYVVLAYWENGFRHFTNSKRPIVKPADMAGLRFRSAESPIRLDMFKQLGASAVPMPFPELYAALQQGVVDGQENPAVLVRSAGLYNVQKYLSLSGHIWNAAPFVVSKDWWEKLPAPAQQALRDAAMQYRLKQREAASSGEQEILADLRSKGMEINEVDKEAFAKAVEPVWTTWEARIGPDLMKLARQIREAK